MSFRLFRAVSYESAVFPDGILVFAIESGLTSLLPSAYGAVLARVDALPQGQYLSGEQVVPADTCIDGATAEDIRQMMINVGVVAVC